MRPGNDPPTSVLVKVALERGYLTPEQAKTAERAVRRSGCSAERALLDLGLLSPRRLSRLHSHVQYRLLRQTDKVYARLAVETGQLTPHQADTALATQRRRFEERRELVRLGAQLVATGTISPRQDEALRVRATRVAEAEGPGASSVALVSGLAQVGAARPDDAATPDSAEEVESALQALARRRQAKASAAKPAPAPTTLRKKTTGALRVLLGLDEVA